ncbi:hypothetical protein ACFOD4_17245 [Pseudoroseomonas globiformis]|uniref:Uncharacterized protein n=1 Tax=Teichococcus globiformis TaxID=2307229 RepID=A0ABV7G288_9PROT
MPQVARHTSRKDDLPPEEVQRAIRRVVEDYNAFLERGPAPGTHDDAKAFAAHHAAAKSALAHLEHLLKLARAAASGDQESHVDHAADLLRRARRAIAAAPDDEERERDDESSG